MSRFEELIATVEEHQALVEENDTRIHRLAEALRDGFCDWLAASDGVCVRLVPPAGQFQPKAYGDKAFSVPPKGFRPLGPVSFGLAIRVSRGTDWMRLVLVARKTGDSFRLEIQGGEAHEFDLPLTEEQTEPDSAVEECVDEGAGEDGAPREPSLFVCEECSCTPLFGEFPAVVSPDIF